jgi:AP-1 complex subunit gamma-1
VKESDIVELLDTIRTSIYATPVINEYLLNAFIKLTSRFQDGAQINRIRTILSQNTSNLNVELQQRAVEYDKLFQFDDIRKGVVERMPAPEIREENRVLGESTPTAKKGRAGGRRAVPAVKPSVSKDLLDILGGEDESAESGGGGLGLSGTEKNAELLNDLFGAGPAVNGGGAPPQPGRSRSNVADIMDLFGSSGAGITAASPPPAVGTSGSMAVLDDIFGRTPAAATATSPPQKNQLRKFLNARVALMVASVVAYSKNDLTVSLQPTRTGPATVSIVAIFRNDSIATTFNKVNMQVAVPKSQKLTLLPISSPTIAVGGESTQSLRVQATKGVQVPVCKIADIQAAVRLRLKMTYTKDGREIVDLVNFDRFPADLLA